jgi:hypothetical protein
VSRYTIHFERVGRHHDVSSLAVDAADPDELAERIHKYALRFLGSRDVTVTVDLSGADIGEGVGRIFCGVRNGGTFTIEEVGAR